MERKQDIKMQTTENHFVGRQHAVKRLHGIFAGQESSGKLTIQGIVGPGGIGKTYLLNHAFSTVNLDSRNYLALRIDGNSSGNTMVRAITQMVSSASAKAIGGHPPGYLFPTVNRVLKVMEAIRCDAIAEFQEKCPQQEEGLKALLQHLDRAYELGEDINNAIPVTKAVADLEKLESAYKLVKEILPSMVSLGKEGGKILERMGWFSSDRSLRNAIKQNACKPLAEALRSDLTAILTGYEKKDWWKGKHPKVKGIDRLLLVLDDYEMHQNHLGEFLVKHFLPVLKDVEFESLVIILCRDRLEATDPGWSQHLRPNLLRRVDLSPLTKDEMSELVESFGVESVEEKERAWRDTQGFPFYVQLWVEEMEDGGPSAVMLKEFYDRTTRWMSAREKRWLQYTLFLDKVNLRTLRYMLDSEQEAEEAFRWFEREGSVRDPAGKSFHVREYIRSRLADYLQVSDPDCFNELKEKGLLAQQVGSP